MPFLDTLVIPKPGGSLTTTVFRKPTHTDQYLPWESHHAISAKYSVASTLLYRVRAVCSTIQHLQEEQEHLQNVLTRCKYPMWALNRIKGKIRALNHPEESKRVPSNQQETVPTPTKMLYSGTVQKRPYWKYQNCLQKTRDTSVLQRRQNHQRHPDGTQRQDPISKKSGVIYRFKCDMVECNEEYIGESSRTFGEKFKEHLKLHSPIYDHFNTTCHTTTLENFSKVRREDQNLMRLIK